MEASPSPVYGARLLSGFGLIPIASSNLAASANTRAPQPWLGGPSRRRRPWARLGYRPWTLKAAQQSNSAADAGRPSSTRSSISPSRRIELGADFDEHVVTGRAWWHRGTLAQGVTVIRYPATTREERHRRHSMVVVPVDSPGVRSRADPPTAPNELPHRLVKSHASTLWVSVR